VLDDWPSETIVHEAHGHDTDLRDLRRRRQKTARSVRQDEDATIGGQRKQLASSLINKGSCPEIPSSRANNKKEDEMSIAKVSEISATSTKSFEDAIKQGIARADKTLRDVRSAWVKELHVRVTKGSITEFQVNMMVTFVLDD